MAAGRPTLYKEEYCDALIAHMQSGLSFESFAGRIGTNRDTLYEWAKVHPKFSDAKKQGTDASLLHWEKLGLNSLFEKTFQAGVYVFTMKARFRWAEQLVIRDDEDRFSTEALKRMSKAEIMQLAEEAVKLLPAETKEGSNGNIHDRGERTDRVNQTVVSPETPTSSS